MASAYMRKNSKGKWETDIYNTDGIFVKTVPTPKSQIRPERVPCLFQPGKEEEDPASLKIQQNMGTTKL